MSVDVAMVNLGYRLYSADDALHNAADRCEAVASWTEEGDFADATILEDVQAAKEKVAEAHALMRRVGEKFARLNGAA